MLSKSEINKRYYEKNKDKIKTNRKRIDVECPICNIVRSIRADSKNITNRCMKCNMRQIRIDRGEILHGLQSHPLHIRWAGMKQRIKDPLKRASYLDKNIIICEEWSNSFLSFYEWSIANGFKPELELDRIDNDGNYCPENCRWVSHQLNCLNR